MQNTTNTKAFIKAQRYGLYKSNTRSPLVDPFKTNRKPKGK